MQDILKLYYGIDVPLQQPGYFSYQDQLYYFQYVQDVYRFLEIYRYYRYFMHHLGIEGYRIVKNHHQDIVSSSHVLLLYQPGTFLFPRYLDIFLQPLPLPPMKVKDVKEKWIQKIDCVREHVKNYAYSFKHDQDMISLIYYYCGLAENSINILNEILSINQQATIALSLSLVHPIENYVYEILNPFHYTVSSRLREIDCLLKSHLMSLEDFQNLLEAQYYDVFELIYLYARILYPSHFFDQVLTKSLDSQKTQSYYLHLQEEKLMYQEVMRILSFYVSLPKISWINKENMV